MKFPNVKKVLAGVVDGKLHCDMTDDCSEPVAYIDEKGWVYCEKHGITRKSSMRCRKLKPQELKQLEDGKPIARY